jgi:mannosyltransferase
MTELTDIMPERAEKKSLGRCFVNELRRRSAQLSAPAIAVAGLTIAGLILRIPHLGSRDLWLDEAASAKFASYDWIHFAKAVIFSPVNMTFYFAVLHVWTRVMGDSEFMLRLPSVLFATATIPLIYILGTKLFDRRAGLASAVLMTFSASSVDFAQEARSYTLVVMLATVSSLFFVESIRKPSLENCAGYVASTVFCIYSHMFGILLLPAHWLSLWLFRPGWKTAWRLTLSAIVVGLIAAPHFAIALGGNVVHLAWVQRTSHQRVLEFIALITGVGDNLIRARNFLIACSIIAAIVAVFDKPHRAAIGFLALGIVVPAATILAVSHFKPLFWPRYLLLSQPFFVAFAGVAISRLRPWPVMAVALVALAIYCVRQDVLCYQRPQSEEWSSAVQFLASGAQPGDVMMVFIPFGRQPIDYYHHRLGISGNFPAFIYPDPNKDLPESTDITVEELLAAPHQRIWLVSTGSGIQPAPFRRAGKEPPTIPFVLKKLIRSSYQLEQLKHFGSLRVFLFDKPNPSGGP